jgi:hypothetical protein
MKLPSIPNTATQMMKKKNLTDFGPGWQSLVLDNVDEESDSKPRQN